MENLMAKALEVIKKEHPGHFGHTSMERRKDCLVCELIGSLEKAVSMPPRDCGALLEKMSSLPRFLLSDILRESEALEDWTEGSGWISADELAALASDFKTKGSSESPGETRGAQ